MKLMFIITRGDRIGGAQVHVRDVSLRLAQDGHSVHVVTGAPGPLTEQLETAGIATTICPGMLREIDPVRDMRAIQRLRAIIAAARPDVISTHSSKAGSLGRVAARLAGRKALFTAHGWAFTEGVPHGRRLVYREIERLEAPLASKIVCVSDFDVALARKAGIPARQLVRIHNGMPDIAIPRAEPGRPGPFRIVSIARLDEQKDHPTLLRALALIPDATLQLVGDGPREAELRQLAEALGVAERVDFLGRQAEVAGVLSAAHCFVLCSHWEGFPRSTLEAMRAGLPAIVTDAGGAREALIEGVTGYCVPRSDPHELADRLAILAARPEQRAALGTAGRQRYESHFTFDHMYEATMALYRLVAAGEPSVTRANPETVRVVRPVLATGRRLMVRGKPWSQDQRVGPPGPQPTIGHAE